MKKTILFLATLMLTIAATAQKVVRDDWQNLQVEFSIGDIAIGETTLGGETFSTVAIEGYQEPAANYGSPALPVFSQLIEVPLCEGFDVVVSDAVYDTLPALKHRLMPVQLPRRKSDTSAFQLFINKEVYSWNTFVGQRHAEVEAVGIARDRRLARLQFSPVKYNPVSGQVIICRHAVVTVTYHGADRNGTLEMFEHFYSPAFNSGAKTLNSLYPKAVRTTAPVRYVIVANSMFRGHLDNLVNWKRRKGFLTDIVYTDNPAVGTTTTSIAAYLKSLYEDATTSNPAPTYVLLVGDVAQLPTFDAQITSPSSDHVTDLYYMTWTAGDHLPDCHYGRFSAQTVAQLTPQVQKTLMYEQYSFADPSFLDRAVMVAGVDGGTAGDHGYTHADPTLDYAITNYVNGAHGFSQVMYFKNNTSIVPAGVTNVTVQSSASSMSATVRNYYNQGAGFINYTAHGSATSWGTPNFTTSHVAQMTNTQKFGLMIGNCCLTNKFEESTCLGESLLRKDNYCGAVGYIGGSNSTYWGQDFYWGVGVRSSIGPSMSMAYDGSHLGVYDRTFHTHGENYANWCTTQGSIVMQGNMAVESSSSSSDMKHYYWEIYHLMGDPSVMPYLTQPSVTTVTMASTLTYGTTTLPISTVPYAYVALSDTVTGTLIAAAYANALGSVTLSLPTDLSVGTYLLSISAQQYRTTFRNINIIHPQGPFPMVTAITSTPLVAGDTVALTLHVENPGNETAHNINLQLSSDNPMLTLSTYSVSFDSLAAGASIDLTGAVSAYVNANASDSSSADIVASSSWTGSTYTASNTIRLWLYAPELVFVFSPDNPNLLPNGTLSITATLRNNGHVATRMSSLEFTSPTALLTATLPTMAPFSLAPGSETTVTVTLHADAQLPQDIYLPLNYSFDGHGGELPVFIGQGFLETFEGGHTNLAGWNPPAAYPWAVSTEQPYEGNYCLRSVQYMGSSQNSDMSFNITVQSADSVSFYYRVSSEENYDKFHFLIDNVSQFNASGEVGWTRASFPLSAGNHVLTFRYAKDYSVNSGSDCAWIDNVILPHSTHSVTFNHSNACFGEPLTVAGHTIATDELGNGAFSVTAANGNVTLYDYTVHPTYDLTTAVSACDSYLWQGVEYTSSTYLYDTLLSVYGCDSVMGIALTVNHSTVGDTIYVSTLSTTYEWYGTVYSTSGTYPQTLTNSQGCDSLITLVLTINNTQGIDDISDLTKLNVYPNPTYGQVHFGTIVNEAVVFDLLGHELMRRHDIQSLDLGALPQGVYLLRLTQSEGTATQRVMKR